MDIDAIPAGVDFREYIVEALRETDVLIALIGPAWIGKTEHGEVRIADEDDPVRVEVEAALRLGKRIMPVLLEQSVMPKPSELPAALAQLCYLNAAQVDVGRDFHTHMDRLIASLDALLAPEAQRRSVDEGAATLHNLPLQLTELIGRDVEVADVVGLLEVHRLVTVVGAGGVGKTRVTLQAGENLMGRFEDGVWFVDLAPLTNGGFVPSAVALAAGLTLDGENPLAALTRLMKRRRLLLILDNCEHLIDDVARTVLAILRECPGVSILASSRQFLGIVGEAPYRLPPLPVPPEGEGTAISAQAARAYAAVELFVLRAAAADSRFDLTDENAPFVTQICRRLDGIPLALELAAARVKVLAPHRIAQKLGERFRLLTGGTREALPRQQTLRATIDWSHDLLLPRERALFRRLAIFVGGWTLEAAESVCRDEAPDLQILDDIASLVDKSLASFDARGAGRYRFLETTREYALEKLDESKEQSALARKRANWVASFADGAYEQSWTSPQSRWLAGVLPEIENVRAALQWTLDGEGDLEIGGRIGGGLATLWRARRVGEGRRYVENILNRWVAGSAPEVEARLWATLAALNVAKRKVDAADRAVALYEQIGDRRGLAESLRCRAEGLRNMQQIEPAERAAGQAQELFHALGLQSGLHYAELLQTRASLLVNTGRNDEARRAFDDVLRRLEFIGDESSIAVAKMKLADLEFLAGNVTRALTLAEEAVQTCAKLGDITKQSGVLVNIAAYHLLAGEVAEARIAASEALQVGLLAEAAFFVALALQHLGTIAALSGDARRGATLLYYVDRWLKAEGVERELTERRTYELGMCAALEALGAELAELSPLGAALSEEEAIAEARQVR
jgi:predicted ATPase